MKNGVKQLVMLLGMILILATMPAMSAMALGVVDFPLMTDKGVLAANEKTAMITTFEQDPISRMITANVQLQQGGTEDIETSVLGIAIYFDNSRVAPYSFNDKTAEPACFTGSITPDTHKDKLSEAFGAYCKKNTASGFKVESNQLVQNEPGSQDAYISIMLNHTDSGNNHVERIIHAGEKLDIASFYFMPINENDSKLDLDMFKFKFMRDDTFIRITNFLGTDTYMLEASSLGIDPSKYTWVRNAQSFRIHMQQPAPEVEANNGTRQIKGYNTNTMQWSYDGSEYNDGAPVVLDEGHEIYVKVKGSEYGGNDGLYTNYKKYLDSEATVVEFEKVPDPEKSGQPEVNPVTEEDKEITGTGIPGAEITVTFPDGETETATVDGDGSWTVEVPDDMTLEPGDEIEVVQVEDGKGPSDPVTVTVDEKDEEPEPEKSGQPEVNPVTEGDKEITGKGEPGAEIIVTFPDGETETAIVGGDGNWTVEIPDDMALEPGDEIEVVQVEEGKGPSDPVTVTVDEKPEPDISWKPAINPVTEGNTVITGDGIPGAAIIVTFPDGKTGEAIVDGEGSWKVNVPDDLRLRPGDEIKAVQVEDGKGPSEPATVIVDAKAVEKPVEKPAETSAMPEIYPVTEGDTKITGAGVPGARVIVSFPGGKTGIARVDRNGEWSVNVPKGLVLEAGDTIIARQIEHAKKESGSATVKVQAKQEESEPPIVNPVKEGDKKITGKGEPGAEIIVEFPDEVTETALVDEDGNWSIAVPDEVALKHGDEIKVVQTEDGKKPSQPVIITVDPRARQNRSDGTRYSDIDEWDIPLMYLEKGEHRKYIVGYTDKTVRADSSITRAEVAMIFYRLLQEDYQGGSTRPSFKDVSNGAWYGQAVGTLAQLGILQGYEDGTFRPNAPITRAEFAVVAARFDELEYVSDIAFTDVTAAHWAIESIQSAYAKGWVNGYADGQFRPEQNITRAEVTKIIDTMLSRLPEELPEDLINPYTDLRTTHGAYVNIMEASTEHTYSRDDDGIEFWMTYICPITGKELVNVADSELFLALMLDEGE